MTFILLEKKKARCSVLMVDSAIPCSVPVPLTLHLLWVPSACLSENPVSEMLPGVDSLLNQLNGLFVVIVVRKLSKMLLALLFTLSHKALGTNGVIN